MRLQAAGLVLCGVVVVALLPCNVWPQSADASIADRAERLKREMAGVLAEHHVPSVSIAQIEGGKVVLAAAYGMQSPGVPATPGTLYNIASLTKPITAETVLRLASAGRLSLDEPMYKFWIDPDLASDERAKLLTPRMSLSHQTGFANWRRMTGGVLAFKHAPGEAYGYSGEGYQYVARFAAKRTGSSFEELVQKMVYGPLRMQDTASTGRPWFEGRVALPTDKDGKSLQPKIAESANAADLVYTTASDYAKLLVSIMRHEGISDELYQERVRIQVSTLNPQCGAACPEADGMGMGWEILKIHGQTFLTHGGSDDGVRTFVYMNLADRVGTVILTNSANGDEVVLPILERLGQEAGFTQLMRASLH